MPHRLLPSLAWLVVALVGAWVFLSICCTIDPGFMAWLTQGF